MAYAQQISQFVDEQLPGFVQDEAPLFADFLQAYYEYIEQSGQALGTLRTLTQNQDIDQASDDFVQFFFNEVIKEIPPNVRGDKAILAKNIKDLYRAKGSQNAYKFLFRLLFDTDVEFSYPGDKILRASDGRFNKETTLRAVLELNGNSLDSLGGETVVGNQGARARVDSITTTIESGLTIRTLKLSEVEGEFFDGETFSVINSTITGTVNATIGPLRSLTVIDGGARHLQGDIVNVVSTQGTGASGTARVVSTVGDSAVDFRIVNGGSGYRANVIYSTTEGGGSTLTPGISGGSGQGASFRVKTISSVETVSLNTDTIEGMRNVRLTSDPFSADPFIDNTVATTLASANVNTTLTTALSFNTSAQVGTISEIELVNPGTGYSTIPTVNAIDTGVIEILGELSDGSGGIKGQNAVIVANNLFGTISELEVVNQGVRYNKNNTVSIRNITSSNTFNGVASLVPTGVANTVGVYADNNRGILGGDNVLQDNYYYQEYSYVLQSRIGQDLYRAVVEKLLHPSGTILFSNQIIEIEIQQEIPTVVEVKSAPIEIEFVPPTLIQTNLVEMVEADVVRRQELQLNVAETVVVTAGPVVVSFRIDPVGTIAPTTVVTSPEIVLTIGNVGGITSTTAFTTPDTIQPMADVNLNANPFSSDGDIGSVTTELSSANVDTTLITALGGGIIITQ
tara:strand:+ start:1222 stop:3270 length:2049 start_codon:yes stop_codon:yes gene_type:complete